ncbi:hypothetical protein [Scytonema millei]|uniref:Uncharacterized protein n=1 Tax=Scytonema millei VB511283 TaxID=1245923 RepID=A0A9X5E2F5_9CYAN|nr:hypothetical protein [Scytonema millei]NHC33832.1 hypothetical protein [Scytonema millei VB511283]
MDEVGFGERPFTVCQHVDPSSAYVESRHANSLTLSQMVADMRYTICTFATFTDWLILRH